MKHFRDFIIEAVSKQISKYSNALSLREYKLGKNIFDEIGKPKTLDGQTAQEILKMIDIFTSKIKASKKEYSLDNRTSCKKAYKEFLSSCKFAESDKEKKLKQFHLGTQDQFRGFWLSNADLLSEHNIYIDWIYQLNGRTLKNEYRKYLESDDYVKPIPKKDIKDLKKINPEYIIVYSRWDPDTYELFEKELESSLDYQETERFTNMFKMNFGKDCDVEYFECYPIKVKNFIEKQNLLHNNDYQNSQEGYDDPSEY